MLLFKTELARPDEVPGAGRDDAAAPTRAGKDALPPGGCLAVGDLVAHPDLNAATPQVRHPTVPGPPANEPGYPQAYGAVPALRTTGSRPGLAALAAEMSPETDDIATVIALKRLTPTVAPRERRHVNPSAQAPGQARYLNGKLVATTATDYGGYAVSFLVSQSRLRMTRSSPCRPATAVWGLAQA